MKENLEEQKVEKNEDSNKRVESNAVEIVEDNKLENSVDASQIVREKSEVVSYFLAI